MASDVNPELRAELMAALAKLEPQIRGLHDLVHTSISIELQQEINIQIQIRERRRDRIQAVLSFLDNAVEARAFLEKDGYPDIEGTKLDGPLFSELTGENDDLDAAVNIFKPDNAQNLSVDFGKAADKPPTKE